MKKLKLKGERHSRTAVILFMNYTIGSVLYSIPVALESDVDVAVVVNVLVVAAVKVALSVVVAVFLLVFS